MSRAKAEKGTTYYILEKHVNGPERFVPAYKTDPNQQSADDDQQSLINNMKNIIWETVNKPGWKYFEEIVSFMVSINQGIESMIILKYMHNVTFGAWG